MIPTIPQPDERRKRKMRQVLGFFILFWCLSFCSVVTFPSTSGSMILALICYADIVIWFLVLLFGINGILSYNYCSTVTNIGYLVISSGIINPVLSIIMLFCFLPVQLHNTSLIEKIFYYFPDQKFRSYNFICHLQIFSLIILMVFYIVLLAGYGLSIYNWDISLLNLIIYILFSLLTIISFVVVSLFIKKNENMFYPIYELILQNRFE